LAQGQLICDTGSRVFANKCTSELQRPTWLQGQGRRVWHIFLMIFVILWILNVSLRPRCWRLGPSLCPYWEVGPSRVNLGHLEGDVGTPVFPLSFYFSTTSGEQFSFPTCFSCHDILPCHRPKGSRAKWPWTEIYETLNQNKSFFRLSWLIWGTCHGGGNLTNTMLMSDRCLLVFNKLYLLSPTSPFLFLKVSFLKSLLPLYFFFFYVFFL
jgi:hypothetical protein